jgi:hypothetical protein
MNQMKPLQHPKGQALAEMIVAIPLLFLLAAGMIQFTLLFLSYVQFEHACGEAARQYAAGVINKGSLRPQITQELGDYRRFFDIDSLSVAAVAPASSTAAIAEKTRNAMGNIPMVQWGFNYDGAKWKVRVQFKSPFFFKLIFPEGVPFSTTLQVYRYPS